MNIVRSVKRICAGALVVCAVAGVAAAQTPQEEYVSALTNMAAHPEGMYTLHLDTTIPFLMNARANQTLSIQTRPFAVKGHTDVQSQGVQPVAVRADVYARQEGDAIDVYHRENEGEWIRDSVKLNDSAPIENKMAATPKIDTTYFQGVRKTGADTYVLTVDPSKLNIDAILVRLNSVPTAKAYNSQELKTITGVLQALKESGPIDITTYIDKSSNKIRHAEVPLTGQLRSLMKYGVMSVDALTPAERLIADQVTDYSSVILTVDYAPLPDNVDLQVPDYVKKSAANRFKDAIKMGQCEPSTR